MSGKDDEGVSSDALYIVCLKLRQGGMILQTQNREL